jgi:BolA protein
MSENTADLLRHRRTALAPAARTSADESARHAGHAGARGGGGHFHVDIVAAAFSGQNTLARHRLVYDAAGDLLRDRIHALSVNARAPDEV